MKSLIFVLLVILFSLQYSFWFGKHGVCDFLYIRNNLKIKEYDNCRYKLKVCNNDLLFEINDLINHRDRAMEERARNELNMIKSDEFFYRLLPVEKKY